MAPPRLLYSFLPAPVGVLDQVPVRAEPEVAVFVIVFFEVHDPASLWGSEAVVRAQHSDQCSVLPLAACGLIVFSE